MAGIKQIQAAQVVLLRKASTEADRLVRDLKELGIAQVAVAASAVELASFIAAGKVDVVVVDDYDHPSGHGSDDLGPLRPPAEALNAGVPCLLTTARPPALFNRSGFAVVLGAHPPARVLYRRIGALLQRARRIGREREAARRVAA
jgi:hypothetical protein